MFVNLGKAINEIMSYERRLKLLAEGFKDCQYINDYLNKVNPRPVFDMGLLEELKKYKANDKYKIQRVFRKCLKFKHFNWASNIQDKYPEAFENQSDLVMAFGMSLMASNK